MVMFQSGVMTLRITVKRNVNWRWRYPLVRWVAEARIDTRPNPLGRGVGATRKGALARLAENLDTKTGWGA